MTQATTAGIGPLDCAEPLPRRRSLRRFVVWTVGTIVIGGMVISVLLPSLCRSSETANRVKCQSNLRQISQAIAIYARDNGGQYPPSLAVLPACEDITAEVMVCPSSSDEPASGAAPAVVVAELQAAETNAAGHKPCLSYVYVGRALNSTNVSATAIVAYEPLNNHDGDGTSVLFGDGQVDFVSKQHWPKAAAAGGIVLASTTTGP